MKVAVLFFQAVNVFFQFSADGVSFGRHKEQAAADILVNHKKFQASPSIRWSHILAVSGIFKCSSSSFFVLKRHRRRAR